VETRTDIPPWTIGIFALNRPMLISGSFTIPPKRII